MYEKLKRFLDQDTLFTSLLICGVAILAFLLGRLSVDGGALTTQPAAVGRVQLIASPTPPATAGERVGVDTLPPEVSTHHSTAAGAFVASKSGTKFHHVSCPGAKQIKEENKIFFTSPAEAMAAGYSQAANCKLP
jgi:hypothetical protein